VFVFESGHQAGWEGNNAMDDVDRLALAAARETLQTDLDLHDEENLANFLAAEQVLAVDEALQRLARLDQRQSRIVECRFFGGFLKTLRVIPFLLTPATLGG